MRDTRRAALVALKRPRRVVVGRFEAGHSDEEIGKLSAVHVVRFAIPPEARRLFRDAPAAEIGIVVEHPNARARAVLSLDTRGALAADLE